MLLSLTTMTMCRDPKPCHSAVRWICWRLHHSGSRQESDTALRITQTRCLRPAGACFRNCCAVLWDLPGHLRERAMRGEPSLHCQPQEHDRGARSGEGSMRVRKYRKTHGTSRKNTRALENVMDVSLDSYGIVKNKIPHTKTD